LNVSKLAVKVAEIEIKAFTEEIIIAGGNSTKTTKCSRLPPKNFSCLFLQILEVIRRFVKEDNEASK